MNAKLEERQSAKGFWKERQHKEGKKDEQHPKETAKK